MRLCPNHLFTMVFCCIPCIPAPIRAVLTAAIIFVLTIIIDDVVYCYTQDLTPVDKGICMVSRLTMDADNVYQGKSLERFVLPFSLAGVYILIEILIHSRRPRTYTRLRPESGSAPV